MSFGRSVSGLIRDMSFGKSVSGLIRDMSFGRSVSEWPYKRYVLW